MRSQMWRKAKAWLLDVITDHALDRIVRDRPDVIIGGEEKPCLLRWYIIPRNPIFTVYIHMMLRPDDDRALHDHPGCNVSAILGGSYVEVTRGAGGSMVSTRRRRGDIVFRWAKQAHRLVTDVARRDGTRHEFNWGTLYTGYAPCISLFLMGPRWREWGFHCPKGWVHWREYTKPGAPGEIGRGCDV